MDPRRNIGKLLHNMFEFQDTAPHLRPVLFWANRHDTKVFFADKLAETQYAALPQGPTGN